MIAVRSGWLRRPGRRRRRFRAGPGERLQLLAKGKAEQMDLNHLFGAAQPGEVDRGAADDEALRRGPEIGGSALKIEFRRSFGVGRRVALVAQMLEQLLGMASSVGGRRGGLCVKFSHVAKMAILRVIRNNFRKGVRRLNPRLRESAHRERSDGDADFNRCSACVLRTNAVRMIHRRRMGRLMAFRAGLGAKWRA